MARWPVPNFFGPFGSWRCFGSYSTEDSIKPFRPESRAIGPAWTRGKMEAPAGERDMGGCMSMITRLLIAFPTDHNRNRFWKDNDC